MAKGLELHNISPSSEYSGLISFKIDWFDLVVQDSVPIIPKPKRAILWWSFTTMHRVAKNSSLHMQIPTARFCCFNSYAVNKCSFWSLFSTTAACSFALFIGDFTVYSDPHVSSWGAIWWARCALQREWLDDMLGSQCCRPWEQHYWITINIQVF